MANEDPDTRCAKHVAYWDPKVLSELFPVEQWVQEKGRAAGMDGLSLEDWGKARLWLRGRVAVRELDFEDLMAIEYFLKRDGPGDAVPEPPPEIDPTVEEVLDHFLGRDEWVTEVGNHDTSLGYRDWQTHRLESILDDHFTERLDGDIRHEGETVAAGDLLLQLSQDEDNRKETRTLVSQLSDACAKQKEESEKVVYGGKPLPTPKL